MSNPLQGYPTATTPAADDWLYLQGATNDVRKLAPAYFGQSGNRVWVDAVFGNDATGLVQRRDKPFATVSAAVAAITDAATDKRYNVMIAPGNYQSEQRDIFKSWVFLCADTIGSFDNEGVHLQTALGGSFKIPVEAGSSAAIFGAAGISFESYVNLAVANTRVLRAIFKNCTFLSGMDNFGGGANFLSFELYECVFEAPFTSNFGYVIAFNCLFTGDVTLDIPQSCPSGFGSLNRVMVFNSPCFGGFIVNMSATSGTHLCTLNTSPNFGVAMSNTGGNSTANTRLAIDLVSNPTSSLFSSTGWTINRINDASGLKYTPATPGDWAGTAPTTVQEALDRLAAASSSPP